jgi:HK97 family phage prohead protease
LETREIELRLGEQERTITGIAVPYDQTANIAGQYEEKFAPGAIRSIENVKLFADHKDPIGKIIAGRETPSGYEIMAKVSDTPRGNEVLTLMRDGVLNKFSVGFVPLEQTRDGNVVTRTAVDLKEVSVVSFPAYSGAEIKQVREETPEPQPEEEPGEPMSENIELDVRTVQDEVAELRRVVEAGMTVATPATIGEQYDSVGAYAKGLAAREDAAIQLARTASTSSNTVALPGWLGYVNNLIDNNRPTLSAFSRAALPANGLVVEYASIDSNSLYVEEQDGENAGLAFGNLAIGAHTANVKTYGGYTSFSKQTVERSSVPYLNTVFQGLSISYAAATNSAVIAALAGLTWTGKIMTADGGTAASLLQGVANGAAYIKVHSGLQPEFILASPDAYVQIMAVADLAGRPVALSTGAGFNNVGTANVPGLTGTLFGLPVIVDPQLPTGTVYLANSAAVQTLEAAGAPIRLQRDDITTLTDNVSVYGYMAVTVPFEGAIVKLDVID